MGVQKRADNSYEAVVLRAERRYNPGSTKRPRDAQTSGVMATGVWS